MDLHEQVRILTLDGEDFAELGIDPSSVNEKLLKEVVELLKNDLYDRFSECLQSAYENALDLQSSITYSMWHSKPTPRIHHNYTVLDEDAARSAIAAFEQDLWDDDTQVVWDGGAHYLSLERRIDRSHPDLTDIKLTMTNRDWLAVSKAFAN